MRAIIAGGRNFVPEDKHAEWLVGLLEELGIDTVLSGCASGADSFGEGIAYSLRLKVKKYPANWMKYGNRAGPIRNEQMAKEGDMVKQYRKKPVVIQAIQYDGFHTGAINDFCGNKVREPVGEHYLEIETLEGVMRANAGDYIIRGVNGEFYPCKPDIFEKTYEEVSCA